MQNSEHDFIAREEAETVNSFDVESDDVSSDEELLRLKQMGYVPFADAQRAMDDLIEQSSELSREVASKIRLDELSEDNGDLIATTFVDIEKVCNEKPLMEKIGNRLPSIIGKPLINMANNNHYKSVRSQKVSEIADKHFSALNNKKENLKDQMNALIDLDEKLKQFNGLMKQQELSIDKNLKMLSGYKSNKIKMEILQGKELLVQVMHQINVTKDLRDQISLVVNAGESSVMLIQKVLPSLKSNFIDQLAVSTTLQNLRSLQDAVAKTREMTLSIREITARETSAALADLSKTSITYTNDEFKRIQKIENEKAKLHQEISNRLVERNQNMDAQLQQLKQMNSREMLSISEAPQMAKIDYKGMSDAEVAKEQKSIDNLKDEKNSKGV